MIVALGVSGTLLPMTINAKVVELLWRIVTIHEQLWDRTGHTQSQLDDIDYNIQVMLLLFLELFGNISVSHCRFLKYHLTLHLTAVITEYGSLRIVDTRFGETKNKAVKHTYRQTNRKTINNTAQMHDKTTTRRSLQDRARRRCM